MRFANDLSALDYRFRAKRNAQSPAEYAEPFEHYRRPASTASRVAAVLAVLLLAAAALMAAS